MAATSTNDAKEQAARIATQRNLKYARTAATSTNDAKEQAARIATQRNLEYARSLQRDFVVSVATYTFELFTAAVDLYTGYLSD